MKPYDLDKLFVNALREWMGFDPLFSDVEKEGHFLDEEDAPFAFEEDDLEIP